MRAPAKSAANGSSALLRADGVDVSWPEILARAAGGTVGRPHIAQALIRAGLVGSTGRGVRRPDWLGERYRLPKDDIDVFRAVELVRAAGGVPVFAHPRASRRGRVVPGRADRRAGRRRAVRAGGRPRGPLARPSGSTSGRSPPSWVWWSPAPRDFHGTHKTVRLGAFTTAPEAYERIVARPAG